MDEVGEMDEVELINRDSTDEEIQDFIFQQDRLEVDILGRSTYQGKLVLLVSWFEEVYLDEIKQIVGSIIKDGEEIIDRYTNRRTACIGNRAKKSMISISGYAKRLGIAERLIDLRFEQNLPHEMVQIKSYNVYMISYGCGCFRFQPR